METVRQSDRRSARVVITVPVTLLDPSNPLFGVTRAKALVPFVKLIPMPANGMEPTVAYSPIGMAAAAENRYLPRQGR